MLTYQKIKDIPPECSPAYFWHINGKVKIEELKQQLRDMHALGLRSVCLHAFPDEFRPATQPSHVNIPYLSPEWFEMVCALCDECRRLGMRYWLYDEGGWPSGGAGGQVWKNAKDKKSIQRQYLELENGSPVIRTVEEDPRVCAPYPDILNKQVTADFIALTHERYRKYAEKYFGREIRFAFTDEPGMFVTSPGKLTYTAGLKKEFKKIKGYELEPYLPALLEPEEADESRDVTLARIDYHEVLSQLFVRRFLHPLRTWCRKNRILSGGHFSGENNPWANRYGSYGNILQSLRALDIPGVDAICRQLFPGGEVHPFPKYASSAANQNGNRYAFAEVFALYGNGMAPAEMRWLVDFMFVRGINLIVPSKIAVYNGESFMSGIRPHSGTVDPLWKYMKEFHTYISRGCHLLSVGKPYCRTAVYFDIRSIRAGGKYMEEAVGMHESVAQKMLEHQCAFDFIDDEMLAKARREEKSLKVGKMRYETIVVPSSFFMTEPARENLEFLRQSGGTVLDSAFAVNAERLISLAQPNINIRVTKRLYGENAIYFIVNESSEPQNIRIEFPEKENIIYYDTLSGEMFDVSSENGAFDWSFTKWGSVFFITGLKNVDTVPPPGDMRTVMRLDDGWTLRALRSHCPGKMDYEILDLNESPVPVSLGDWRSLLGNSFSGEAVYRTTFASDGKTDLYLDLGGVCYACSVSVNGRELGRKFLPPYIFRLDRNLLKRDNILEVTVANTLSNSICDESVLEYWSENWPLQYEAMQRPFEKDHLESGLLGPVKIQKIIKI